MTRKPDDWMPLHIGKYLANTTRLTRDQHGAYLLLLMAYWTNGGPLDADDAELAATARATPAEWKRLRPVLVKFFTEEGGKWHQKKADKELTKAVALTEAKAAAGRKGAASKWQRHGTANDTDMAEPSNSHRQSDAPLPLPKPIDLSSFVLGRGRASEPMSDENKIALFQKWLATSIGKNGWQIVGVAADPTSDGYADAVAFCRAHAKKNGKGWPHKWPTPQVAAE